MEDDLFFADLNKQISLLIMDEDDADVAISPPWSSYPHQDMSSPQGHGQEQEQQQGRRDVQEKKNHQQGMSKGTGVFIPKLAQPRRKRSATFNHHPSIHHNHSYNINNNYYTTRRFSQDQSKAFINPDKI